jgi:hypothetical protein
MLPLEVRWVEQAWSFRNLGYALPEADTVAGPDLPLSSRGFYRDPAWVSAVLLNELAAKAARAELNAEFLCSHVSIVLDGELSSRLPMPRSRSPTYLSGEEIRPSDQVLYHGERKRIEFGDRARLLATSTVLTDASRCCA